MRINAKVHGIEIGDQIGLTAKEFADLFASTRKVTDRN
jgi:hypothetical protein